MHALTLLNREFAALGFHRKPTGRLLAELALHVALLLGGTIVFLAAEGWLPRLAALAAVTLGNLGIATHTHSSSHNANSPKLWVNKALTFFGYGVVFGTSSAWWWNKHIAVHHATPNVIGLDDDVDLLPWFALTQDEYDSGGPLRRRYYRWQWTVLPLALALTQVNMSFVSWRFLYGALRDPRRRSTLHWVDVGAIAAHFGVWLALPLLWFPAGTVVGFYLLRGALMGFAVFAFSAPAHFPAEASFLATEGHASRGEYRRHSDYLLLQTATTVNFRCGWFGVLFCSGSQYQIEHHLFPGISHVHYPRMSPVLRRFCEENGYPYRTLGWWEGVCKALAVFRHPKPVEPALEAVRLRAAVEEVPTLIA